MNKPPNLVLPRVSRPVAATIMRWLGRPSTTLIDPAASVIEVGAAIEVVLLIGIMRHAKTSATLLAAVMTGICVMIWHRCVDHDGPPPGPRSAAT